MIIINVEIPEDLKKGIKILAITLGKTFKQVIAEALMEKLEREKSK